MTSLHFSNIRTHAEAIQKTVLSAYSQIESSIEDWDERIKGTYALAWIAGLQ